MEVTRCVCFNITFAELKAYADERGDCDEQTLRRRFHCGRGCGLCLPYIRRMLRSGETRFPLTGPEPLQRTL